MEAVHLRPGTSRLAPGCQQGTGVSEVSRHRELEGFLQLWSRALLAQNSSTRELTGFSSQPVQVCLRREGRLNCPPSLITSRRNGLHVLFDHFKCGPRWERQCLNASLSREF